MFLHLHGDGMVVALLFTNSATGTRILVNGRKAAVSQIESRAAQFEAILALVATVTFDNTYGTPFDALEQAAGCFDNHGYHIL